MNIIRNIRQLKNAGILAERNASTPSLDFKRYNLIYGFNGSGKSTLSRIFSTLQTGTRRPRLPEACSFEIEMDDGAKHAFPNGPPGLENRIFVFNHDFIADNLRWTQGEANPVFYIGVDQAEAAAELEILEADMQAALAKRDAARNMVIELNKMFAEFKRLAAATVRDRLRQPSRYEAGQYASDVEKLRVTDGDKLDATSLDAATAICARSEPPVKIAAVEVPVDQILMSILTAADLTSTSIGSVVIEEFEVHPMMVQWVKHGQDYHQAHGLETCLFCGETISAARRHLLAQAFDAKVSAFIDAITRAARRARAACDAMITARTAVATAAYQSAEFHSEFEKASAIFSGAINDVQPMLEAVLAALNARSAAPTNTVAVVLPTAQEVTRLVGVLGDAAKALDAVCKQHGEMVEDFTAHQRKAREAIRRHYVAENAEAFGRHLASIEIASNNENIANEAVRTLEANIAVLKGKLKQHGPAAEKMTALIRSYLGHGELTIATVENGYELHRHGALVRGEPSEGEKTAIALCYFLSTLAAEDRKIKSLIVVVDDPVSSLDTRAMNFACSLLRNRLADAAQLFILTHNHHCMNEFKKDWKKRARDDAAKQTASLKFIDVSVPAATKLRSSTIIALPKTLRNYDSEYHYLFGKILAFEAAGEDHSDYAFMMPNVLRRVLEIFLAFRVPREGSISDKLNTLATRHTFDLDRLNALERLAQVESHSDNLDDLISQSSMTIEESRDANKALIQLMKTVDYAHEADLRLYCSR